MKQKYLNWLLIISLLAAGWFFYKWQQHATILEEKLYEFTDNSIFNLYYLTEPQLTFSEETASLHLRMRDAAYAVEYASEMYHKYPDSPLDSTEATYLQVFQDVLKLKYLPLTETHGEISEEDKQQLLELSTHLKEANFPQDPISVIGWPGYIQAVERFLKLEGRITEDGNIFG